MSKRVLTILVATLIAIGAFGAVASAGVEGDFTFDFMIKPQTTVAQWDKFDFNFEGLLNLNITLSGLTMSNYMAFGLAGLETYVLGLTTTLGALDLNDEFWFSVLYGGPTVCLEGLDGELYRCDPRLDDVLRFVKKRVDASITIGGLTFDMLVIFEDLNFSYGYNGPVGDNYVSDYQFGACFTLSGTTVSGIGVTSVTGINCDNQVPNVIKKHSAMGRVQTDELGFTVEKIYITGIEVSGITTDFTIKFTPDTPVAFTTTISTTLLGLVDLVIVGSTYDITQVPQFNTLVLSMSIGDYITVDWTDDGDFVMDADDTIAISATIPIQGATLSADITTVPGTGITSVAYGMSIPVDIGTLSLGVTYAGDPLSWNTFTFALSSTVGGLDFDMGAVFGISGLDHIDLEIGIPFSV